MPCVQIIMCVRTLFGEYIVFRTPAFRLPNRPRQYAETLNQISKQ